MVWVILFVVISIGLELDIILNQKNTGSMQQLDIKCQEDLARDIPEDNHCSKTTRERPPI